MTGLPWILHIGYYVHQMNYSDSTSARYPTLRDCICAMHTTEKLWAEAGYRLAFAWADGPDNVRVPLRGIVPQSDTVSVKETIVFDPEW